MQVSFHYSADGREFVFGSIERVIDGEIGQDERGTWARIWGYDLPPIRIDLMNRRTNTYHHCCPLKTSKSNS